MTGVQTCALPISAIIAFFYGQANKAREDTMKQMKDMKGDK